MEVKIFVAEDDPAIFDSLKEGLEKWGLKVVGPPDFKDVTASFIAEKPHLVNMNIQLPVYDGFHWCREIRAHSKVPLIFLSSRDHLMEMAMLLFGYYPQTVKMALR